MMINYVGAIHELPVQEPKGENNVDKKRGKMLNKWMKYDKAFAPLRRVIKQKNFDISSTVDMLEDIAPDGLTAFARDLEEIEQFLDSVHERAIKEVMEGMKRKSRA